MTAHYLAPIGQSLELGSSIQIDIETSMIITDNMNTGYILLYGSNENVGGYQINGTVTKEMDGTTIYDMNYTFNDIMDPNFNVPADRVRYAGLAFLKFFISKINM